MISKVFLVLIIVIMAFAFPKIYAQMSQDTCGTWKFDCYKESGFRLTSNPVICMDLPSDRNIVSKMRAYTEDAVMDWENKLNANNPSAWNIQLLTMGMSDACNISIQFIAKPTLDQQGGISDAVGITRFYTDHTAEIEIFYNAIDDGGNFLDSQAPDYQIQWTIKHELGHAFGLDHYMMTDEEQKDWLTGLTPTPSIMVQIVPSAFSVTGTWITYPPIVTYKDIAQLKSLYNNNGFGGQAHTTFPSMQPSTTSPVSQPVSTNQSLQSTIVIPATLKNEVRDWSMNKIGNEGFDNFVKYLDAVQAIKVQPATQNANSQIVIPSWIKKNTKLWLNGDMSDNDYFMTIQYMINNKIIILSDLPTYTNNDSSSQVQNFGSCPQDQVEQFLSLKKQIDTLRPQIQTMPKVFSTQSQYVHYYNLISQYNDLIEKYNNIVSQFDDSNCMNK